MSSLRTQLEQAQSAYQSARYPGDLAAVVLGGHSKRPLFWRLYASIAAAACVAMVAGAIWTRLRPQPGVSRAPIAATSPAYDIPSIAAMPAPVSLPAAPAFPTDLPLTPGDGYSSFPSPVSFPSSIPTWNPSTDTTPS